MNKIVLYQPKLEEMSFREKCLGDLETMAYNHAYGGTIPFPRERWADWHTRWVGDDTGERFYRYLYDEVEQIFVGEAAYHFDDEFGAYVCDVLVSAKYRGFGRSGLDLLCAAAKANGVKRLVDNIAVDNPSVGLFLSAGFCERFRNEEYILMEKEL